VIGLETSVDCLEADGELTLDNTNTVDVLATVTDSNGNVVEDGILVEAGGEVTISDLADGEYTVATTLEDGTLVSETIVTVDRDDPVDVQVDCVEADGELTLKNTDSVAVTATVLDSDGNVVEADVQIDANGEATISGLDDGEYTVRIELLDGTVVQEETVTVDCDVSVDVQVDCVEADGELTLKNTNDVAVTVKVTGPNGYEESVPIEPNSEQKLSGLADGEYTVETMIDGEVVATVTVTVDCDAPDPEPVDVDVECVDNAGEVTFTNPNDQNVTVAVGSGQGGPAVTFTLEPGEKETVSGAADGEHTVSTIIDGDVVDTQTIEVDCREEPNSVDVDVECVEADGEMTLANPNDQEVTVVVSGPEDAQVTIGPNEEKTISGPEDGQYTASTVIGQLSVGTEAVTVDCDGPDDDQRAFQADLAFGEPIQDLGENEDAFYGRQGRLIQAVSLLEDGTYTDTFRTPPQGETAESVPGDCTVEYSAIEYDSDTGDVTADVALPADADCESVTVTLAIYELPDGTVQFQRDRADEQQLVDSQTVELSPGESKTLTINVGN